MTGGEVLARILKIGRPDLAAAAWTEIEWGRWASRIYGNAVSLSARGLKEPPLAAPWTPPTKALIAATLARNRALLAAALAIRAHEIDLPASARSWGARAAELGITADDEPDVRQLLAGVVWYEWAQRLATNFADPEESRCAD